MEKIVHLPENDVEQKYLEFLLKYFSPLGSKPVYLTGKILKEEGIFYSSIVLSSMVRKALLKSEKSEEIGQKKGYLYSWVPNVPPNIFHVRTIIKECKDYISNSSKSFKKEQKKKEEILSDIDSLILSYFKEASPGAILKTGKIYKEVFTDLTSPNNFHRHISLLEKSGKLKKIRKGEYVLVRDKEEKPIQKEEEKETPEEKIFQLVKDFPEVVKSYFSIVEKSAGEDWELVDFFTPKKNETLGVSQLNLRDFEGRWGFLTSLDVIDAVNLLRKQNFIDCQKDPTMKLLYKPVVVYYLVTNFQILNY